MSSHRLISAYLYGAAVACFSFDRDISDEFKRLGDKFHSGDITDDDRRLAINIIRTSRERTILSLSAEDYEHISRAELTQALSMFNTLIAQLSGELELP